MAPVPAPSIPESDNLSFEELRDLAYTDPDKYSGLAYKAVQIPNIKPKERKLIINNAAGQTIAYAIMDDKDIVKLYWGHGGLMDDQKEGGYNSLEEAIQDLERNLRQAEYEIW